MRLYIDIWTGQLRKTPGGAPLGPLSFYFRDILPMELVYTDGNELVTSQVLADNKLQKVALKSRAGARQLLAFASTYVLVGEVATTTFSLNSEELETYLTDGVPTNTPSCGMAFEVEVTAADGVSSRQTYHQSQCVVHKEVNTEGDTDPTPVDASLYVLLASMLDGAGHGISPNFLAFRSDITSLVGGEEGCLDFITTAALSVPFACFVRLTAAGGQLWVLEEDAGTVADGEWVVDPVDFNALSNPRKWKRYL